MDGKFGIILTMKNIIMSAVVASLSAVSAWAQNSDPLTLWKKGDAGVAVYRIPALCTAPNGDLVAACDARKNHGADLNSGQPINISIRRSTDNGKTWTDPVNSWTWQYDNEAHWAGSDPSFIVDAKTKTIFLFYNVWESKGNKGVFQFWVQESKDNGATWSKPRDISKDIAFDGWPFGDPKGFIFISSGSGIQTKNGWLLHTLVHVGDGNALFGSKDHGKTWQPIGKPVTCGDECKVVELNNGAWMINSRWKGGGRQIHVSKNKGQSWESRYDTTLTDPQCNAQIMRYGKVLLFSNCNAKGRSNVTLRASADDGKTWSKGIVICAGGSAYSDITILKSGDIGVLYESAGYGGLDFVTVPKADIKKDLGK